jgi:ribosomal protein S18 acetylase RimI-like enzyme
MKTENDLPAWLTTNLIIQFLEDHLSPYNDPYQLLHEAIDYSLSIDPEGEGFIILAAIRNKIVGLVVCVRTNTTGFIPENVLVYVCVHRDYRRKGIGRSLVQEAIENTDGDIKIHVIKSNPAVHFLNKLGFTSKLLEMRLFKGEKRWVQSKKNIKRIKESGTGAQEPMKNKL